MEPFAEIAGGLIIVSGAVLIVYFLAKYTYLIKKMRLEKGMPEQPSTHRLSKWDMAGVIIGIGVALLIAAPLTLLGLAEDMMDFLTWGLVLILGMLGLIAAGKWQG